MKATVLDTRRSPRKTLEAIERNEIVTLSRHGREIAKIVPTRSEKRLLDIKNSPAFGMWKDREDMADPVKYVRELRKARYRESLKPTS